MRVRDLEIALVLAREMKAAAARSVDASLRLEQLQEVFGAATLEHGERARIQTALQMAGLEPRPSLLEANPSEPIRFVATAKAPAAAGGGAVAPPEEEGDAPAQTFPTVGQFARSKLSRPRRFGVRRGDDHGLVPPPPPPSEEDVAATDVHDVPPPEEAVAETASNEGEPGAGEPDSDATAVHGVVAEPEFVDAPEAEAGDEAEAAPAPEPEVAPAPDAEVAPESEAEVAPEPETEVAAEPDLEPEPEAALEAQPGPEAEPEAQPEPEPVLETQPEPAHEEHAEPEPAHAYAAPVGYDAYAAAAVQPEPEPTPAVQQPAGARAEDVIAALLPAVAIPVLVTSVAGWSFGLPFVALSVIATGILLARRSTGLLTTLRQSPATATVLKTTAAVTVLSVAASILLTSLNKDSSKSDSNVADKPVTPAKEQPRKPPAAAKTPATPDEPATTPKKKNKKPEEKKPPEAVKEPAPDPGTEGLVRVPPKSSTSGGGPNGTGTGTQPSQTAPPPSTGTAPDTSTP